jgi:hypothetical protein
MATLKEYFTKDGATNLTVHETWPIADRETGQMYGEVIARIHFDFEAYAQYVSFFIPDMEGVELPEAFALREIPHLLKSPAEQVQVISGFGSERTDGKDLVFTGQVYLYSERPVKEEYKERLRREGAAAGHRLIFRSTEYMDERNKAERPLAFISHSNLDKKTLRSHSRWSSKK